MENNRKNKLICILFALFFAFGFFLCVLLPKKEYSYSERRKLAQLPKCSKETLWNRLHSVFAIYIKHTLQKKILYSSL